MPSAFDDAWQAGAVLDDHFGEDFVLVPRQAPQRENGRFDVNARAVVPGGVAYPFVGLFQAEPVNRLPSSRGHASSDASGISAGLIHVEYAVAALAVEPKPNDMIQRPATGTTYLVADVGRPVNGRRRLRLTLETPV